MNSIKYWTIIVLIGIMSINANATKKTFYFKKKLYNATLSDSGKTIGEIVRKYDTLKIATPVKITHTANFKKTTFTCFTDFSITTFQKEAFFDNAIFKKKIDFQGVQFIGTANFIGTFFDDSANFIAANFDSVSSFSKAHFNKEVVYNKATFKKKCIFLSDTFKGPALYLDTKFDSISFNLSIFENFTSFFNSKYKKDAAYNSSVFRKKVNFSKSTFTGPAYFFASRFDDTAYFENVNFDHIASFSKAKFKKYVAFNKTVFQKKVDFSGAIFNMDADFYDANFDNYADFFGSQFDSSVSFIGANFDSIASFSNAKFNKSVYFRSLNQTSPLKTLFFFYGTHLPDTIDFSNNPNINGQINLSAANFNDSDRFDFLQRCYKENRYHFISLFRSDVSKFRLDYLHFRLLLINPVTKSVLSTDEASSLYEALLKNFKDRGQMDSYELLDIEYQLFKWQQKPAWIRWFGTIPYRWNRFGYEKGLVFCWSLTFILFFTIITFFALPFLQANVYAFDMLITQGDTENDLDSKSPKTKRIISIWHPLLYTSMVFFSLSLKTDKLKFGDSWQEKLGSLYILTVYITGIVCLAYMTNFVLQK